MKQEQVCVLGLGETGLSMAKWAYALGADVRVADTRTSPPMLEQLRKELPEVAFYSGSFTDTVLNGMDRLLVSPGVSLAQPAIEAAIQKGASAAGDIELFAEAIERETTAGRPRPAVIGITGSNGKTTVTTLVGAICKAAGLDTEVAGNIAPAVLTAWENCREQGRYPEAWALELSSFQLETTHTLSLDAAVILNISEDHLDRYEDMNGYIEAKKRIFQHCRTVILNRDEPLSASFADNPSKVITFGLDMPDDHAFGICDVNGEQWLAYGQQHLMKVADMRLFGRHNVSNMLAAFALTYAIGVPFDAMVSVGKTFSGLPHRVEYVATVNQVSFYDDSKGTNVGATVAALNGIDVPVILIAGGDGKGQDFSPLKPVVEAHARAVLLIGRDADKIEAALAGVSVPVIRAELLPEAVQRSYALAQAGDVVLLSPACASWDMFDGYAHRARVFIDAVKALA